MRQNFARLLKLFSLLIVSLVLALGVLILWDTLFPSQRVADFANTTFTGPTGATLQAYLALPAQPTGDSAPPGATQPPGAAVLLVHEFFGLNADIVAKADLLAARGYTVLAPDVYRGHTTQSFARGAFLVLTSPRPRILNDLAAAYSHLAALPGVDPARIAAVGFCFGGTQVMHFAANGAAYPAATVIFYGNGPLRHPAALGHMDQGGPVLAIYGENDRGIPLDQVHAFRTAMDARQVPNTVTIYYGVGHAFVNAQTLAQPGPAAIAWQQMLSFLQTNLQ